MHSRRFRWRTRPPPPRRRLPRPGSRPRRRSSSREAQSSGSTACCGRHGSPRYISTISRSRYLNKHLQYLGHGAAGLHLLVPQQDDGELQPRPGQGGGHAPGRHGLHTHGQFRGLNIYILCSADL